MTSEKNDSGAKFFGWLNRVNAIGIFCVLAYAVFTWVASDIAYRDVYYGDAKFGNENRDSDGGYVADEYETTGGPVQVYMYGDPPNMDDGRVSSGMTLVDARSGRQTSILDKGENALLASFEVIENSQSQAIAYLARITDEAGYAKGRAKLVVGSFETFEQIEIAKDAPFVDAKALTNDGKLALVYWPDDTSARLVTIDLSDMSIADAQGLDMPPPQTYSPRNKPSGEPAEAAAKEAESSL